MDDGDLDPERVIARLAGTRPGGRTRLFRKIIEIFTREDPPEGQTRQLLLDIVVKVLDDVDEVVRAHAISVMRRLAVEGEAPLDLAARLAVDRLALTAPLITELPFHEDDLIAIARHGSTKHHRALASRPDLTHKVWTAIAAASAGKGLPQAIDPADAATLAAPPPPPGQLSEFKASSAPLGRTGMLARELLTDRGLKLIEAGDQAVAFLSSGGADIRGRSLLHLLRCHCGCDGGQLRRMAQARRPLRDLPVSPTAGCERDIMLLRGRARFGDDGRFTGYHATLSSVA